MAAIDEATRVEVEQMIAGLAELDVVEWLEVARDVDVPSTTGLLSVFASYDDLETYRVHPDHLPVIERIRGLGIPATRLDVEAPLPSVEMNASR